MKILGVIAAGVFFLYLGARPAMAIIILPVVILIPLAKVVALIIGALSLPSVTIGAIWSRLFKKSLARILASIITILAAAGIGLLLVLKIFFPEHPLF